MGTPQPARFESTPQTADGVSEVHPGLKAVAGDDISQEQTQLPSGIERLAQEYGLTEEQFLAIGSIAAGFLKNEKDAQIYQGGRNQYFGGNMRADDVLREQYRLTQREIEVIECIAGELSTEETADALTLSAETVRSHIKAALRKTGVHSRVDLLNKIKNWSDALNVNDSDGKTQLLSAGDIVMLRDRSAEIEPLPLTAPEIMILTLLSLGLSTRAVADHLDIEEQVVKITHESINKRTGISSTKEAAEYLADHSRSQPWLRIKQ